MYLCESVGPAQVLLFTLTWLKAAFRDKSRDERKDLDIRQYVPLGQFESRYEEITNARYGCSMHM